MPICRAIPPPLGPEGRIGSFAACQAYIEGQERDRPSHTFSHDVVSLDTAALEMDAQADLSRCKDPVCHWVISYHSDEPATNEVIEADTYQLLKAIDLAGHQFIAAVHDDTDNRHVHVVANRVGPKGLAAQMAWFKLRSERCMARVALKRGVAVVPGKFNRDVLAEQQAALGERGRVRSFAPDIRSRLKGRDRARLERSGDLPWYELARPAVIEAAKHATSWQQFSAALFRHGIVLKHTVRIAGKDGRAFHGLAFAEGHEVGVPGCKASAIGSEFRYKALAARWGEYPGDTEGRARAALLARPGIPGRGEVARTRGEGREAARQRRVRAQGSTVALEAGSQWPRRRSVSDSDQAWGEGKTVSGAEQHQRLDADPDAQLPVANPARTVISLPAAQRATEQILVGLRARAARSKRRRRQDNLQRWASASAVVEPHPNGAGRLCSGAMRGRAQKDQAVGQLLDLNINDHALLKKQYDDYLAQQQLARKATEDEAWQKMWDQERVTRQQERDRLRRSEQAKRRLTVECLQPGPFRRIWLVGLKLRYWRKRARLKTQQSERWAKIRSDWSAECSRVELLSYKAWLRERAAADEVAARQHAWVDSMDRRRVDARPAALAVQGQESDERPMETSELDMVLQDEIAAAEPQARQETKAVSLSDLRRDAGDLPAVDLRLLAAARMAASAGSLRIHETFREGRGAAGDDAPATLDEIQVQQETDHLTAVDHSTELHRDAGLASENDTLQGKAPVAVSASLQTGAVPAVRLTNDENASVIGQKHAGIEAVPNTEPRVNNNVEPQVREVAQASPMRLSIGEQAREAALRSQARAALARSKSGGASENWSHERGEARQVRPPEERPEKVSPPQELPEAPKTVHVGSSPTDEPSAVTMPATCSIISSARSEEDEEAPVVGQKRAREEVVPDPGFRVNNNGEPQAREAVQAPLMRLSIGEQAREAALRSQARAARNGIISGDIPENPSQKIRETMQAQQDQVPGQLAQSEVSRPTLSKTVGSAVQPPEVHYGSEPFHRPAEQGGVSAPILPAPRGPVGSSTSAAGPSESRFSSLAVRSIPASVPPEPQAMVQPGLKSDAVLTDAVSAAVEALALISKPPAPASAPAAPASALPAPAQVDPLEEAALRAAAALRAQDPLPSSGHLREIAKASAQSLFEMQPEAALPTSATRKADQGSSGHFDPIRDANGQQRNPLFQQIAATAVHAYICDDQNLLDSASTLLCDCLDTPRELAAPIAGGILRWHFQTNEKPNMPPLSLEGCNRVARLMKEQRNAGRGDDWMWSWKGLPPDRTPSRPRPRRNKGFGIDD